MALLIGLFAMSIVAAGLLEWRARSADTSKRGRKTARGLASMVYVVIGILAALIALAYFVAGGGT